MAKLPKQRHDLIVVLLGDKLPAGDPVIDDRVVFFQQSLELTKLFSAEFRETLIGKGADQQVGLARAAVPGTESELATEHVERFAIGRHRRSGLIGCQAIWHGM